MLLSLSNLMLYEPSKNRWGKMRPGPSGPFVSSSVVGDSFPGEVFGVLQHTSARKGPIHHGWEYFTGTELTTAFAISAICDSLIDSIRIAHLALNLSPLNRNVSAMVHDNICQRLSLLTEPSIESSRRRPERRKSLTLNSSPSNPVVLTSFPVARLGGSQHLWRQLCIAVAHRHWGRCQLGNLVEKLNV